MVDSKQPEQPIEQTEAGEGYTVYHVAPYELGENQTQPIVVKARTLDEAIDKAKKQYKGSK